MPPNYAGKLEEFFEEQLKTLKPGRPITSLGAEHDDRASDLTESDISDGEAPAAVQSVAAFRKVTKGLKPKMAKIEKKNQGA